MTVIDPQVYDDAADLIERDGWWQGGWPNRGAQHSEPGTEETDDGHCTWTAIAKAAWEDRFNVGLAFCKATHLALGDADVVDTIATWNDADGRTVQQVVDALRYAGKEARREEEGLL